MSARSLALRIPASLIGHATTDAVDGVQRAVYDVMLEKINEHANIDAMTLKQQAVVFKLLRRSMENENLLDVVNEVAHLSDEDINTFRRVLERTTLDAIVRLSSEVTGRLHFLAALHELVYGDVAKHVKERSQLHKIVEGQCWIFGPEYHLASSDKSFREIVRRHRSAADLEPVTDCDVAAIKGVADIPDLFLAAEREYPTGLKHARILVELKAPLVSAGRKQLEQVRRYAETIRLSPQFDADSTRWDVILVTTDVLDEIEFDRRQRGRPTGLAYEQEGLRVWVFRWGEIIERAREEMRLVRRHLENKSRELSVSEYLKENFPHILDDLRERQAAAPSADRNSPKANGPSRGSQPAKAKAKPAKAKPAKAKPAKAKQAPQGKQTRQARRKAIRSGASDS